MLSFETKGNKIFVKIFLDHNNIVRFWSLFEEVVYQIGKAFQYRTIEEEDSFWQPSITTEFETWYDEAEIDVKIITYNEYADKIYRNEIRKAAIASAVYELWEDVEHTALDYTPDISPKVMIDEVIVKERSIDDMTHEMKITIKFKGVA